ncbi:MAG: VCBS repeat-containing protein [Pirellulales bacterium]
MIRIFVFIVVASLAGSSFAQLKFEMQQPDVRLAIGYAVSLADMNEDSKPDLLIVDKNRVIWLENPGWKLHTIIETPGKTDNVCVAPYDIDRDGKLDIALGADWTLNTRAGGTIQWLRRGAKADEPWSVHSIGEEPTVHRMRWVDLDADGRSELVVLPLLGRDSTRPHFAERGVRVLAYKIPTDPVQDSWRPEVLNSDLHVTHNFWPTDLDRDGRIDLLVTSFEGVSLLTRPAKEAKWSRILVGEGNQKTSPNRGASEVKHGKLSGNREYVATIEPWHGHQVVVYTRPAPSTEKPPAADRLWTRHVLDEELQWGHAVWCANIDGDADEELIIGVRDDKEGTQSARRGVRIYDPAGDKPGEWKRTLVDPGGVAVEDMAAADLDGDGRTDVVAVGRQTNNVRIYWNRGK